MRDKPRIAWKQPQKDSDPCCSGLVVLPAQCHYSDTFGFEGKAMKVELVTSLKRQATKILAELSRTKEPVLITEHGLPSAYLVDVEDFECMQRRLSLLEDLVRGERAVLESRTCSQNEAKEKMGKWLK